MKTKLTFASYGAMLAVAPLSQAQAFDIDPYISANLQSVHVGDTFFDYSPADVGIEAEVEPGFGIGISAGARFFKYFRLEEEFTYRKSEIDSAVVTIGGVGLSGLLNGSVSSYSFMTNGYFDWENKTRFTPYIGAGLGLSKVKMKDGLLVDDSDVVFSYQALLGVSYDFDKNHGAYLGYRYFDTNKGSYTSNVGADLSADYSFHAFEIGYRYTF